MPTSCFHHHVGPVNLWVNAKKNATFCGIFYGHLMGLILGFTPVKLDIISAFLGVHGLIGAFQHLFNAFLRQCGRRPNLQIQHLVAMKLTVN